MDSLPPGTDLSTIPLAPNPSGAPPNFVDPPSLTPAFLGIGIAFIIVCSILIVLRVFTYLKTLGKVHLDDCGSMIFFLPEPSARSSSMSSLWLTYES